jgi:hypothetical protein
VKERCADFGGQSKLHALFLFAAHYLENGQAYRLDQTHVFVSARAIDAL